MLTVPFDLNNIWSMPPSPPVSVFEILWSCYYGPQKKCRLPKNGFILRSVHIFLILHQIISETRFFPYSKDRIITPCRNYHQFCPFCPQQSQVERSSSLWSGKIAKTCSNCLTCAKSCNKCQNNLTLSLWREKEKKKFTVDKTPCDDR